MIRRLRFAWLIPAIIVAAKVLPLSAAEEAIISPAPAGTPGTVVADGLPVTGGRAYILHWMMNVEGERAWRFKAEFAGIQVHYLDGAGEPIGAVLRHTHCYRTLGWQRAWMLVEPPAETRSLRVAFAIESNEALPGRFLVRDMELGDLEQPPTAGDGQAVLQIDVTDAEGNTTPARLYVTDSDGTAHVPPFAYAFTLGAQCFYLPDPRLGRMVLPPGTYTVRAMQGFEHAIAVETVTLAPGEVRDVELRLQRQFDYAASGWWSGDHHTHLFRHGSSVYPMMNLHDVYRIGQAEGMSYLPFMGEDKLCGPERGFRAPGFIGFATAEVTRDTWGHVCPIGVNEWPSFDNYHDLWPMNYDWIFAANERGGAMAYAHPYSRMRDVGVLAHIGNFDGGHGARGYPIDAALGAEFTLDMLTMEADSAPYEVKLRDYMRLLNTGPRIGVSGSTDFHADQGRQPIGGLRTYVHANALEWPDIATAYREGRTFATNGPLVTLAGDGMDVGETVSLDAPGDVTVHVTAQSLWGVEGVEIWQDGMLTAMLAASNGRVDQQIAIPIRRGGWVLAIVKGRAVSEVMAAPEGNAMVDGQYAITSPVYLDVAGHPPSTAPEAAAYFLEWIDAVESGFIAACARARADGRPVPSDNQEVVISRLNDARGYFRDHLD
jgi:hypothetical protein